MFKIVCLVAVIACALAQDGPPPFLQGASPADLASFQAIFASAGGLTDAQIDAKVAAWMNTRPAIKAKYQAFEKQEAAESDKAHKAAVARFSPGAKAADAKLTAISNNAALTAQQKDKAVFDFMTNLKKTQPAVAAELEKALQG